MLYKFMAFMTFAKNFTIPIVILALLTLWAQKRRGLGFLLAAGASIAVADGLNNWILKPLFARPRPCLSLTHVISVINCTRGFSFPSSHAVNIFTAATLVSFYFKNTYLLAFTLAFLVGFSRIYLGVHYPSDILGGAILGIMIGYGGTQLNGWMNQRLNL